MRSCVEFSAPCSSLTVVVVVAPARGGWMEAEIGAVTGGDGTAVTGVPAPGSVFTETESDSRKQV